MLKRIILSCLLSLPILLGMAHGEEPKPDIEKIVKKFDQLYRSESSYAVMEMEIITPHWERTLKLEAWTKGKEKTFIVINEPKKEQGTATLRIGNEMWNYLPKTNKVMKIPPSMMMSSWMGSDFTNDDLVREFSMVEDYTYHYVTVEDAQPGVLTIEFVPREDLPIVWGRIVVAVREKDIIPVWQKYYDEKDEVMRVLNFRDVQEFDDRTIPAVMEMISQNKGGHRTTVRYLEVEFDIAIDEDIFTLRNLRRRR